MKKITLFKSGAMLYCILSLFIISIFSLQNVNAQHNEPCGLDGIYEKKLSEDPGLIDHYNDLEKQLQKAIKLNKSNSTTRDHDFHIPVVVHVLHLGEEHETNISYDQIVSAIDALNEDFRKIPGTNGDGNGVDTEIEFCLAKRRPDGSNFPNPLEYGVNRVDMSDICGSCPSGIIPGTQLENDIKAASYFPSHDYLNIWIVNKITGASSNGEVIGYTYFPNTTVDELQGIVVKYNAFGTMGTLDPDFDMNRIITHEAGHFLGLFHTFEGDNGGASCPPTDPNLGDKVGDTDPHIRSASNSCSTDMNDCPATSQPYQNIVHNYLDYSSQTCMNEFTEKQAERMQSTLTEFRGGLLHSLGCESGDCAVDVSFETTTLEIFTGDIVDFDNLSTGTNTYEWFVDGESVSTDTDLDNYEFTESSIIDVCLQATNGCTNQYCIEMIVYKDGLCGLADLPYCENLLNGDMSKYDIPVNSDGTFDDPYNFLESFNEIDIVCNWTSGYSSAFFCHESDQPHFGLLSDGVASEVIATTNKINLNLNETYFLSFEYSVGVNGSNSPPPNELNNIVVGAVDNFKGSIPSVNPIASIPVDKIDWYESGQLICAYDKPFNRVSNIPISLTNDNNRYINFFFECNPPNNTAYVLYLRNISIKECLSCEPKPSIEASTDDGCSYSFSGTNSGDSGPSFWTIEGGPTIYNEEDISHTFALPGTYEVCYSISCDEGPPVTVCEEVTIDASCEDCDPTIIQVEAIKCESNGDEYMSNFSFQVDKGFRPCVDDDIYFDYSGGTGIVSSIEIDESDIDFDVINVSILFYDENGAIENGTAGVGSMILCGPYGASKCYQFEITTSTECDNCNLVQIILLARCNDSNEYDDEFEYSGTWQFTPPTGAVPCGYTSEQPGYDATITPNGNGSYTIDYNFSSTDTEDYFFNTTFCFEIGNQQFCYEVETKTETCPPPIECATSYTYPAPIECDEVIEGNAYFNFSISTPPFADFYICYRTESPTSDDGNIKVNYETPTSINFSFVIPCHEIGLHSEPFSFKMIYCRANGDMFCREFSFFPTCDDCPDKFKGEEEVEITRRVSRSNTEYSIFPNPASSTLHIANKSNDYSGMHKIEIIDNIGKVVFSTTSENKYLDIDISNFNNGMYILRITKEDKLEHVQKVVILR